MSNISPISSSLISGAMPKALGRYELIGTLAHGGMGTVYLGRHSGEAGFQRLYAIKILHPHLAADVSFVEMLLDEARIAARLHHPNVVPIVDLGAQEGIHYVVMEYVEGCSLSGLLAKHRDNRPSRLVVPLILGALSGLHAAHKLVDDDGRPMNLVHRDVSPHNVLVGVDGTARLTDFGVAKAESSIHSTRPGQLKGKLGFMSPEHVKDSSKVDPRSDIFSAGAMLWSALTGRRLFLGGTDSETIHNILTMEIHPPSTVGLKPPASLDAVCLRALDRDPDKRFPTALEFEEALREAAASQLASTREVSAWVTSTLEQDLMDCRSVIRATVAEMGAKSSPSDSGASSTSESKRSGLRPIPSVEPKAYSVEDSGPSSERLPVDSRDTISTSASPQQQRPYRNKMLGAVGVLALAGVVAGLFFFATRHDRARDHDRERAVAAPTADRSVAPSSGAAPAASTQVASTPTATPATTTTTTTTTTVVVTSHTSPITTPRSPPPLTRVLTPATLGKPPTTPTVGAQPAASNQAGAASTAGKPKREIEKEDPYGTKK